jgi:hypothetical protein
VAVEWSFQNTNTLSCSRGADGTVTCTSDHPHGLERCINGPVVYANSEDRNLYALNQGGTLKARIFQQLALRAAYAPPRRHGANLAVVGRLSPNGLAHKRLPQAQCAQS